MTLSDHVSLGSPISSDALNLFLLAADRRVARRAQGRQMPYERTYDDLVVSADNYEDAVRGARWLETAIEGSGLEVNQKKKDASGFQPATRPQLVHNIVVNNPRGTRANPEHARTALRLGESYVRSAKSVSPHSLLALARKRDKVTGWINHLDQLHFSPVRQLRRLLRHGDEHVLRKLTPLRLTAHKNKWWLRSPKRNEPFRLSSIWRKRLRERIPKVQL